MLSASAAIPGRCAAVGDVAAVDDKQWLGVRATYGLPALACVSFTIEPQQGSMTPPLTRRSSLGVSVRMLWARSDSLELVVLFMMLSISVVGPGWAAHR